MKFERAALSAAHLWSSPFVRWQGRLADVSSLDLAVAVTRDALAARQFDASRVQQIVLGTTIPQQGAFYAAPWIAARLGLTGIGGPHIAQACATSVACIVAAATAVEVDRRCGSLVVAADRTSNGPLLVYPRSRGAGGSPATENWVLDNFAADPWTGQPMVATAEAVAREGGFSRAAVDDVTLLRYQQYANALADDRAFQRRTLQPVVVGEGKRRLVVDADEGIHETTAEGLAALTPTVEGGVVTFGSQTHPADGAAGFARADKARMPKAATTAAVKALSDAGLAWSDVAIVTTHNPFAINDLWFAQQTGFALEKMNPFGCSLVYGHPQAPTGMRGIVELVEALRLRGGGVGVFTGCAAGDTGAALVVRVG